MKRVKEIFERIKRFVCNHRKQAIIVGCIAVAIVVLLCLLLMKGCASGVDSNASSNAQSPAILTGTTSTQNSKDNNDKQEGSANDEPSAISTPADVDSATSNSAETDAAPQTVDTISPQVNNNAQESSAPPVGDSAPVAATPAPTPTPEKHWVVDYQQVWIEDSAATDEQVPVYGYIEVSVCNVCGATITSNESAHGKAHMLAGEGSGHHNEMQQTLTGYNTIHHDATGHWESIEADGHWE